MGISPKKDVDLALQGPMMTRWNYTWMEPMLYVTDQDEMRDWVLFVRKLMNLLFYEQKDYAQGGTLTDLIGTGMRMAMRIG